MAGLVPAIHVFLAGAPQGVDARHKAGHDESAFRALTSSSWNGNVLAQDAGAGPRECFPRRTATISATIEIAISSGVIAPRSRPAGALSFARRSAATPRCASVAFKVSAFRRLPTKAT